MKASWRAPKLLIKNYRQFFSRSHALDTFIKKGTRRDEIIQGMEPKTKEFGRKITSNELVNIEPVTICALEIKLPKHYQFCPIFATVFVGELIR